MEIEQETILKKTQTIQINGKNCEVITRSVNNQDYFIVYLTTKNILVLDQEEYNCFLIDNKVYG